MAEVMQGNRLSRIARRAFMAFWPIVLGLGVVVAILASRPTMADVPPLSGLDRHAATYLAQTAGFDVEQVPTRSERQVGQVLSQSPAAGARAQKGDEVTLVVSSGPPLTSVPGVAGGKVRRARTLLRRAGLIPAVIRRRSARAARNRVATTDPPATARVARGTRVKVFVSTGPSRLRAPQLQGFALPAAERELSQLGLEALVQRRPSRLPPGTVAAQSPEPGGWVKAGGEVRVFVAVPGTNLRLARIVGDDATRAARALRARGLEVSVRYRRVRGEIRDGAILAQSPIAGSRLRPGARVRLLVARHERADRRRARRRAGRKAR